MSGRKDDDGKLMYHLIPSCVEQELALVLTFGAKKYGKHNWKEVEDFEERYLSALRRHLNAYQSGQKKDKETGFSHLSHALANVAFLLWKELEDGKK